MAVTNPSATFGTPPDATRTEAGLSHELDAPPWLRVESTLMATANAIRAAYDQRLADLGLTLSLASLLAYIADFGPINQTRAAEHLGQGRAATGAQVDRLEGLGFVERRPDVADRRVWLIAITPAGTELAGSIADIDRVLRAELRAGISRADRQTLAATLIRLQQNLRQNLHSSNDHPTHQGAPT
jgi:DNA-binding MarR family transcriptional regulator